MDRQHIGAWGEECAMRHLHDQGYVVLARNWRAPEGEVDLVAQVGETIVFVEVKTRTTHEYGWPEDSITDAKRRRLQQVAWSYLQAHDLLDAAWRIDVIAIDRTSSGDVGRLEHYIDAIDGEPDLL
jgi:putative endonuclease